ncbi:hypothetical protein NEOKW01_1119 [Nematocida sp. AWRm80]|nr:hypothetical protein NEOKW01_1119 [Nematocida sp. AWRm80]
MKNEKGVSLKQAIEKEKENQKCIDCNGQRPQWGSISFGVFLCLNCAGIHRSFGVNTTIVKSITMDIWEKKETAAMVIGGNKRLLEYLKKHNLIEISKKELYHHPKLTEYKKILQKEVEEQFKGEVEEKRPTHRQNSKHSPRPEIHKESSRKGNTKEKEGNKSISGGTIASSNTSYTPEHSYSSVSSLGGYANTYSSNVSDMFTKTVDYLYSKTATLAEQFSEKVVIPTSELLKDKQQQLKEYLKNKKEDKGEEVFSTGSNERSKKKEAFLERKSMEKWD